MQELASAQKQSTYSGVAAAVAACARVAAFGASAALVAYAVANSGSRDRSQTANVAAAAEIAVDSVAIELLRLVAVVAVPAP